MEGQKPSTTLENARECEKLIDIFNERFNDVKSKKIEFKILASVLNFEAASVPDNFQQEIIHRRTNVGLNARYNNLTMIELHKLVMCNDEFPSLRIHAFK